VTREVSERLSQVTVVATSCDAGEPQTALPLSTFQMTKLLSSQPPMEERYLAFVEKASACTLTLCSCSLCSSLGVERSSLSRPEMSQMMASAI